MNYSKWTKNIDQAKATRFLARHAEFVATHPESKYFPVLIKRIRTLLFTGASWDEMESELGIEENLIYRIVRSSAAIRVV